MNVLDRFLNYVTFDTQSDEESATCPSTDKQKVLGAALVEEMKAIGIADAFMDENGYVYGTVPGDPSLPTIGLIAHLDTAPQAPGANVKPRVVEFDGSDVCLNEEKGMYLSAKDYAYLNNCIGKHLVVTDGNTLLGADNKAGVAEIMACAEYLIQNKPRHATLKIGFTPTRRSAAARTSSMWTALPPTMPTPSTAASWAAWSMRPSTQPLPPSPSRVSASIPALPRTS